MLGRTDVPAFLERGMPDAGNALPRFGCGEIVLWEVEPLFFASSARYRGEG
jgi:hypothetical protein